MPPPSPVAVAAAVAAAVPVAVIPAAVPAAAPASVPGAVPAAVPAAVPPPLPPPPPPPPPRVSPLRSTSSVSIESPGVTPLPAKHNTTRCGCVSSGSLRCVENSACGPATNKRPWWQTWVGMTKSQRHGVTHSKRCSPIETAVKGTDTRSATRNRAREREERTRGEAQKDPQMDRDTDRGRQRVKGGEREGQRTHQTHTCIHTERETDSRQGDGKRRCSTAHLHTAARHAVAGPHRRQKSAHSAGLAARVDPHGQVEPAERGTDWRHGRVPARNTHTHTHVRTHTHPLTLTHRHGQSQAENIHFERVWCQAL